MMRMNIGNLKGDKSTIGHLLPLKKPLKIRRATLADSQPVFTKRIFVYSIDNPIVKRLMQGEYVLDDLINADDDIEFELVGKSLGRMEKILMDSKNEFVYSYNAIEMILGKIPSNAKFTWKGKLAEKKNGSFFIQAFEEGKPITIQENNVDEFYYNYYKVDQYLFCFKIKNLTIISDNNIMYYSERAFRYQEPNMNVEKNPLRITDKVIPKSELLGKYVIRKTYQLTHVDNLAFDFFYDIAENLADNDNIVSIQYYDDVNKKWNDNIIMKKGEKGYKIFLEGRVDRKEHSYMLLIHCSDMELKTLTRFEG